MDEEFHDKERKESMTEYYDLQEKIKEKSQ